MAKATRAQEVSTGTSASLTKHEASDREMHPVIRRAMLGTLREEETPSPATDGGDSTQSSKSESRPTSKHDKAHQEPAQTTDNPSNPSQEADSNVPLTDGNTPETEKESVKKAQPAKKTAPAKRARARTTDDYDFD